MTFDTDIAAAARVLFDGLGTAAVYVSSGGSIATTAIVRRDLQLEPGSVQGPAHTRRVTVEVLAADVGDVTSIRRGEEVHIDGDIYRVEQVLADDGVVVSLACYQA